MRSSMSAKRMRTTMLTAVTMPDGAAVIVDEEDDDGDDDGDHEDCERHAGNHAEVDGPVSLNTESNILDLVGRPI